MSVRRLGRAARRRDLLRALRALAILALALIVLWAVALPLARQRRARRVESATLVALLPADLSDWCLERPALRRVPAALWPDAEGQWRARALSWGLPLAALESDSLLGLSPVGGEWLCARRAGGAWLLAGARDRLHAAAAAAAADSLLRLPGGYSLRLAGQRFLLASDPALLVGGGRGRGGSRRSAPGSSATTSCSAPTGWSSPRPVRAARCSAPSGCRAGCSAKAWPGTVRARRASVASSHSRPARPWPPLPIARWRPCRCCGVARPSVPTAAPCPRSQVESAGTGSCSRPSGAGAERGRRLSRAYSAIAEKAGAARGNCH